MRLSDLFETSTNYKVAMAKAAADGFDLDKRWFHGTVRDFLQFRERTPEDDMKAWDELGPGIYLADTKDTAQRYATSNGYILTCLVRKGPLVDLYNAMVNPDEQLLKQIYQGYSIVAQDPANGLESYASFEEFHRAQATKQLKYHSNRGSKFNQCLSAAGFIGGYWKGSAIPGILVVFKKEDVRIVRRQRHWKW